MSSKLHRFATILFMVLLAATLLFSASAVAQEDTVEGDTPDGEATNTDGNDSKNESENETSIQEENQKIVAQERPDITLLTGLEIYEIDLETNSAIFILHNPTDDLQTVRIDNDVRPTSDTMFVDLGPDDIQRVEMPTWSSMPIHTEVTISLFDVDMPPDEYREAIEEQDETDSYTMHGYPWTPNHQPDVGHAAVVIILSGSTVLLLLLAFLKLDNRLTRLALTINGRNSINRWYLGSKQYEFKADKDLIENVINFTKAWLSGWGLILLHGFFFIWGLTHFLGVDHTNPFLDGSMVYVAMTQLFFATTGRKFIKHIQKTQWKELSEIDPIVGDHRLHLLSPQRFAAMDVYRIIETENGNRKKIPVGTDVLAKVNEENPRDAYEVKRYFPRENIAYVSWVGEVEEVKPSDYRRHKNVVPFLEEKASYGLDRLGRLEDLFGKLVKERAKTLSARRMAILDGESVEGMDNSRDWLRKELSKHGEEDILGDTELNYDDEVSMDDPRQQSRDMPHPSEIDDAHENEGDGQ